MGDVQAANGRCAGCRLGCSAGAMCRLQSGDVQAADGRCSGCRRAMFRLQMRDVQAEVQGQCAGCRREMCRLQMGNVQAVGTKGGCWEKGMYLIRSCIWCLYGCAS